MGEASEPHRGLVRRWFGTRAETARTQTVPKPVASRDAICHGAGSPGLPLCHAPAVSEKGKPGRRVSLAEIFDGRAAP